MNNLQERNDILFAKLVPDYGQCDTLEGETLRAINRIICRYYNDGDYWFDGYGTETAGPAETFLRLHGVPDVRPELEVTYGMDDKDYAAQLDVVLEKIITYIENLTDYRKNYQDMLDCEPRYKNEAY